MAQINKPTDYFNTVLYSGTGSDQSVTGTGFATDWLWIKERNGTDAHFVNDSVRGKGTNNHYLNIFTNTTTAEVDQTTGVNAINSNGFDITYRAELNESGKNYVSWNWLGGGTASSNTDGSITSSVSANTTSGFSIVEFTGTGANATVGHGLGVAPKLIIVKRRPGAQSLRVGINNLGWGNVFYLNQSGGSSAVATAFQSTAPTSSVFSVGTDTGVNGSGDSSIAYCFAPIKGFSKIGKYTGNGSTDGTFIYTGFKPAWIMFKGSASSRNWMIYDSKREGYNVDNDHLKANTSDAEGTSDDIDILSNGFKLRTSGSGENGSGFSYYYMAFAEQPLVGTNNIPCTAR